MKRPKLKNSPISHAVNRLEKQKAKKSTSVRSLRFEVTFFQRNSQSTPDKPCSIYAMFNYGSHKRLPFSTGISCKPQHFDASTATIKTNPQHSKVLTAIKTKANECFADLKLTGRPIDLQLIKAYALGMEIEGVPNVNQCLGIFWVEIIVAKHKLGDLKKGSFLKLRSWHTHLTDFIEERHGQRPTLTAIVPADAQACLLWLRNKKGLSNDVAMRITSHLKRVLEFATANEWIQRNPFMLFRKKMENKRQESLTPNEVAAIETAAFASDVLEQVRDFFLFQCYTGLAYKEVQTLTPAHITTVNGQNCIIQVREKIRKKTNQASVVPLSIEALEILERYREHPLSLKKGVCLPIQANQKVNTYLKQIQHIAGIKKRLTTHVARRTAATYYLNEGMPLTSVSAMLGHSDTRTTTRHYATVNPETVVRDFQAIINKRKPKKA